MRRFPRLAHTVPFICCVVTALAASEPRLVKDINLSAGGAVGLLPGVVAGPLYLFSLIQADSGQELWASNGTANGTQLLRDLNPGTAGSFPTGFVGNGTLVAFAADDGSTGREPWISDGTAAGTRRLGDLVAGSGGCDPCGFVFAGPNLYFTATTPATGREIFVWEGGTAAPRLIADATPGSGSAFTTDSGIGLVESYRTAFGNNAVFWGANTYYLARPDGVVPLLTGSVSTYISTAGLRDDVGAAVGGNFYFCAKVPNGSGTTGIWMSDGTAAGTRQITGSAFPTNTMITNLTAYRGACWFLSYRPDLTGMGRLWRTDGTAAGTIAAIQVEAGQSPIGPNALKVCADKLWFATTTMSNGTARLYASDGTQAGTTVFSSQFSQIAGGDTIPIDFLDVSGGRLHGFAGSPATGKEWWSTDGTTMRLMGEVIPGPADLPNSPGGRGLDGFPHAYATLPSGTGLLFSRKDSVNRLWASSGGSVQELLSVTIGPGAANIGGITSTGNGGAVFSATATDGIGRIWITDGSAEGTRVISDPPIYPGAQSGLFFKGTLVGSGIWCSRGEYPQPPGSTYVPFGVEPMRCDPAAANPSLTLAADIFPGTYQASQGLTGNSSYPEGFTDLGGTVYFSANDGVKGRELWKSTGSGASLVSDINPGAGGSDPNEMGVVNNRLLFIANDGVHGREWWAHDPATGTTQLLNDINPGAANGVDSDPGLNRSWVVMGGFAYIRGDNGSGSQLWRTDGTPAGTTLVKTINAGGNAFPRVTNQGNSFGVLGNRVFFGATDGASGVELWISDGSTAGTQRFADLKPGAGSSSPYGFVVLGGWSWFSADDGVHGRELWRTDGSTVQLVADAVPGAAGLNPSFLVAVGGELVFFGNDGVHGSEPWAWRQGTLAMLKDINPGYPNSLATGLAPNQEPQGYVVASGTTVYFSALGPNSGNELWAYTAADANGNTLPVLTSQPVDSSVTVGQTATFAVTITGTPTPTVQWQRSADGVTWTAITGATGLTYTTPVATLGDNGARFRAIGTNLVGNVASTAARLTVSATTSNTAPVISASANAVQGTIVLP